MEDALLVPASEEGDFEAVFGVFDGHNGPECSNFLKTHFLDALKHQKELSSGDPEQVEIAIKKAAAEVDHSFLQCARKSCWASGSTGVVVVWRGNDLWVANTGDSRAIAVVKGKAVPLTTDHKPHLAEEAKRYAHPVCFSALYCSSYILTFFAHPFVESKSKEVPLQTVDCKDNWR